MATTNNHKLNPSFSKPDDMPEYVSIYDRPKQGKGRPKTCKLCDEQKRERLRQNYKIYYCTDPERERESKNESTHGRKKKQQTMKLKKTIICFDFLKT